ncbi:MAG: phosphotransferase [Nocardioidaceae bacterium]
MTDFDAVADFDNGWDVEAVLVDGRWVDRTPRRPEVDAPLRREVALLPWLAPQLPLPVPKPDIVCEEPLTLRHALLVGEPCPGTSASHGAAVGEFLRALHAVDPLEAVRHGALDAQSAFLSARAIRDRMQREVLPRVAGELHAAAASLLGRMGQSVHEPRLVHGDLGPAHIRVDGDHVGGIIDWGDCCLGDPALDLAWVLHGSAPPFARAVRAAYRPESTVERRSLDWRLLGPWHEVLYGLDLDEPDYVRSGMLGVETRLRLAS